MWRSGMRADTNTMVFRQPPHGRLVYGLEFPPGHYQLNQDTPWWAKGILLYFGKHEVEISRLP